MATTATVSRFCSAGTPRFFPGNTGPCPTNVPPSCPGDTPAPPGCCSRNVWGKAGSGPPCTPPPQPTSSRQSAAESTRPLRPGSCPRLPGSPRPLQDLRLDSVRSQQVWRQYCFRLELDAQTTRCTSKAGAQEHVYSPPSSRSQSAYCCVHEPSEIWGLGVKLQTDFFLSF